ncbi:MAG: SulP family inorganic anion transporter [Sphingomonadaceae bacterium]|nr:SulP family inorganic anion transporter [Sphingomonadaceae bacterium]
MLGIKPARGDLVAGLSVAGLMLPEAVAYAGIAGLPPARALLAAVAGSFVYALAGRSRFAIVSPTSSSAAILAAALAVVPGGLVAKGALATVAVAMTGALFLIAGALRLGGLTGFIARPVLRGFAFGLAIMIILRQLPVLAGVRVPAPDIFRLAWELIATLPAWQWPSVATGLVALTALLALRRLPAIPGAFLVLALGIAASAALDLPGHGVATVGAIDVHPSLPTLPALSAATLSRLGQIAVPLVLILFAESWGTIRALALRHGDRLAPDRELTAFGLANLAAALVQGMPVGAGFSAGSASEAAGARSRATALVAAIGLGLLVALATPLIARLPQPVLAAVVIAALTHALDPAPLRRLWTLGRDQYVALGAAAGVLIFGVLNGMLIAILLSIAALVRKLATPQLVELGRLDDGHSFVDVARHSAAARIPGVAIWRPAEPLFFANAERVLASIEGKLRDDPRPRALVLSLEESFDIDSTALDALLEFAARIGQLGIRLQLARVHDHVRDLLGRAGADALVAASSYSVDDAIAAIGRSA